MDDKRLDVMSLVKDEYIVETAPKTFFNRKKLRAKRYMKLVACVAIIATVFSVSPMRSWADYIVKKLKITINFNENNVMHTKLKSRYLKIVKKFNMIM